MDTHYCYLLVNLACFIVPFLFSFHKRILFYKHWYSFIAGWLLMFCLFIPWDIMFTHYGIWSFNTHYVLGINLMNLPIEEWLFFICIPYACCFTYHSLKVLVKQNFSERFAKTVLLITAIIYIVIALLNTTKWYTFAAHGLCGVFILIHLLVFKSNYLRWFLLMFILILVPFIISNGVLTGIKFWQYPIWNKDVNALADMVVRYNNGHNLGIRIFSMPLDDVAYGMLMLLLTITGFEWIESRRNKFNVF